MRNVTLSDFEVVTLIYWINESIDCEFQERDICLRINTPTNIRVNFSVDWRQLEMISGNNWWNRKKHDIFFIFLMFLAIQVAKQFLFAG